MQYIVVLFPSEMMLYRYARYLLPEEKGHGIDHYQTGTTAQVLYKRTTTTHAIRVEL
jgi:hypothetical protein